MTTHPKREYTSQELDAWGLSEQDHIDAKLEDAIRGTESNFKPELSHLVDRYYPSRIAYIEALEQQSAFDAEEVASALADAPVTWRLSRLINSVVCATKARLEREHLARIEGDA